MMYPDDGYVIGDEKRADYTTGYATHFCGKCCYTQLSGYNYFSDFCSINGPTHTHDFLFLGLYRVLYLQRNMRHFQYQSIYDF